MSDPKAGMGYSEFVYSETRTVLAYARTMMSAERTLLSFSTAGLSLFAGGIGLVKYVNHIVLQATGWLLIPVGIAVWIWGIIKYTKTRRLMKWVGRSLEAQGLYIPDLFIGGKTKELEYGQVPTGNSK